MKQSFFKVIKPMTFRQKREYIWEYYRWHILSVLAISFLAVYGVHEWQNRQATYLQILVTGGNRRLDVLEELRETLNESLIPQKQQGSYSVVLATMNFSISSEEPNIEETTAISTLMAVGELDVMIIDRPSFQHFYEIGGIQPLEVLGLDFDPAIVESINGLPFGIHGSALADFDEVLGEGDWIVAVGAGDARLDATRSFFYQQTLPR